MARTPDPEGDYRLISRKLVKIVREALPEDQNPTPEIEREVEALLRLIREAMGLPSQG